MVSAYTSSIPMAKKHFFTDDHGQDLIEYVLLMLLVAVVCIYLGWAAIHPSSYQRWLPKNSAAATYNQASPKTPDTQTTTLPVAAEHSTPVTLALFVSLLAAFAWIWRQLVIVLTNRAQLEILEILSTTGAMSRAELLAEVKRHRRLLGLLPTSEALSRLVSEGKISIDTGRYRLTTDYIGKRLKL